MAKSTTSKVGEAIKGSASQSLSVLDRFRRFCRRLYKIVSSTVGLVVALLVYSVVGAAIFHAIEGRHEAIEKSDVIAVRESIINETWTNFSSDWDGGRQLEFAEFVRSQLKRYERELHEAFLHGVNTDTEVYVWDFWSAFLFCATVYTTIGYGHIAPATDAGRIVTMVYALFGIPLCLIVMAELGKKMTLALKFLWSFVRRFYRTGTCKKVKETKPIRAIQKTTDGRGGADEATEDSPPQDNDAEQPAYVIDDDFNLPPIIAVGITVAYICAGAAMYRKWESGWSYLDAFYFIFISISTVGFGDVLPDHPRYFLASSVYILLGLSLVAMVINVIMDVVSDTLNKAKDKVIDVGHKIGIDLSVQDIDDSADGGKETKNESKDK